MLVIKCRPGQSISIGGSIELEVLDISLNRVKIGITAPREVAVVRKEVEVTRQENVAAAQADPKALLQLWKTD